MSRLFSIIVSLFILFLVYLWIGHITNRNKDKGGVMNERSEEPASTPRAPNTASIVPEQEEAPEEIREVEKPEPEVEKPVIETPAPATSAKGGHLVIAGNFLERANAEKHLKTIKGLGYNSAEILQFEISEYYTVCAGRYDDPTEARQIAKRIEDSHGIDTYVRQAN